MADILVFHHGDDRAAAEMLAEALGKLGFEPPAGYDEADFAADPGMVRSALDLSVAGIVLWSASSAASHSFRGLAELVSAKGRLLSVCGPAMRPPLEFDDPPAHELIEWDGADLKHPGVVGLSNTLTSRYGVRRHWAAAAMQAKPQEQVKAPWLKPSAAKAQAEPAPVVVKPIAIKPVAAKPAPAPTHKFAPTLAAADPREEPVFRSWKKPLAPAPAPAPIEIPAEILEAVAAQTAAAARPPEPVPEPADPLEQPVFKFMKSAQRKRRGEDEAPRRASAKPARRTHAETAPPAPRKAAPAPALESELPAGFKPMQAIVFPISAESPAKTEPAKPVAAPPVDWAVAAPPAAPLFVADPDPVAEQAAPPAAVEAAPVADVALATPALEQLRKSGGLAIAAMTGGGAFAGALAGVVSAYVANQGFDQQSATATPHESKVDETSPTMGSLLGLDAQARDARDASGFTTVPARTEPARAAPEVQRVSRALDQAASDAATQLPPELDDEALTRALNMHMLAPSALQAYPADPASTKAEKLMLDFSALAEPSQAGAEAFPTTGENALAESDEGELQSFAPQAELREKEAL